MLRSKVRGPSIRVWKAVEPLEGDCSLCINYHHHRDKPEEQGGGEKETKRNEME